VPIVFDFANPSTRTTEETLSLLARMSRFVIADLTDAKSILQELRAIVPDNPSLPVKPVLLASQEEPGMFDFFKRFPWFLACFPFENLDALLAALPESVVAPAEQALTKSRGR
jgi:hypothetical protein